MTNDKLEQAVALRQDIQHLTFMRESWATRPLPPQNSTPGDTWHDISPATAERVRRLMLEDYDGQIAAARAKFEAL